MAVLLGLTCGLSLSSIAGARRTQSAYPRFLRSAKASTMSVTDGIFDPSTDATVASFPDVVQARTYVSFNVVVLVGGNPDFGQDLEPSGTLDGRFFDQDRFAPTKGRRPAPGRPDEIAVNEFAATRFGYRVGQRLELGLFSQEQAGDPSYHWHPPPPKQRTTVTIVGIGLFPDEVLQDDGDRTTRMLLTPAYTESARAYVTYGFQGLVLAHGDADVDATKRRFATVAPPGTSLFRVTSVDEFHALQAVRPLSIALGLFGAIAGLAGMVLVAQALSRLMRLERNERAVVRALGATPGALTGGTLVAPALAILIGTVIGVVLAVAMSPAMPIGPVRKVEVARGFDVDATVMGLGALVVIVVLLALTAATAWGELPHRVVNRRRSSARPSGIVTAAASAGIGPAAVTGLRFALEPGDAATAVPVRSVIPSAAVAVIALVGSITFGASLNTLVHHPRLYGWSWDATVIDGRGYGNLQIDKAHALLDHDPHVATWSGAYFGSDSIDGRDVPLLGMDPGSVVSPPILHGRALEDPSEAVLGAATAAQLHRRIGDTVTLAEDGGPHQLRIVGIATLPTVGIVHGAHTSLGVGAIVASRLVPGFDRDITNNIGTFGPNAIFIRYRRGTDTRAETARLQREVAPIADLAMASVVPAERPAEIVNSSSVGTAPALLAATLVLGAVVSLGLALGASVRRRRRDLTLLKALGFTRRQLAATISWQATATVAIGLLAGLPIGAVVGRASWNLFAHKLEVVPEPTVPLLALLGVVIGAVAIANAAAAIPARTARRVSPSQALGGD